MGSVAQGYGSPALSNGRGAWHLRILMPMDTTNENAHSIAAPPPAADGEGTPTTLLGLCAALSSMGILTHGVALSSDIPVTGASCDSRHVQPGNVFFCKGVAFKPAYLSDALSAGAVAYVCTPQDTEKLAEFGRDAPAIVTSDLRRAMAYIAATTFRHPDQALPVVGITGTKGKSTSAYMLRSIIDTAVEAHGAVGTLSAPRLARGAAAHTTSPQRSAACGIIGSIETYDGVEHFESINTTPEAPDLWRHLANARDAQLAAMVMEVSSQALKYDRTLGLELDVAAFLNIGVDHISPDEHSTFEDYFSSKLRIFSQCHRAVVNLGTDQLERVLTTVQANTEPQGTISKLVSVSAAGPDPLNCADLGPVYPDIWASDIRCEEARLSFVVHGIDAARTGTNNGPSTPQTGSVWSLPVTLGFPGLFNVENALVAIACAELLGIERDDIAAGLAACRVPGRMELIGKPHDQVLCLVDFAHNALSYQKFFSSVAREFPGRRIVALIGAPGGKAYERRRELPQEAARWASHIVISEDDPGREDSVAICREMDGNIAAGATLSDGTLVTHECIFDRQQAIARCLDIALGYAAPTLVCLLGKGDDTLIHRGDEFQPMVSDGDAYRAAAAARGLAV